VRILVTISTDYPWPGIAVRALMKAIYDPGVAMEVTVVHGASQMDWLLAGAALALKQGHEPHPADWKVKHRAAGPIRNQEMVDSGADLCLAFMSENSRGARDCASRAEAAGIRTIRYGPDGSEGTAPW
jgi:hypothetical protein